MSPRARSRGFTLIELLTVVLIAAILMGLAVPSFKNFVANQRVKSTSFDISTALLLARSEAIKRNANVTITPNQTDNWVAGWKVTAVQKVGGVDTSVTLQDQPLIEGISISKAPSSIVFQPTGRPSGGVSYWELTGTQGDRYTRCVRLDPAGLSSTSKVACP